MTRFLAGLALLLATTAGPVAAQLRLETPLQAAVAGDTAPRSARLAARPELTAAKLSLQGLAGGAGGLAGAFVAFVPFAMASFGGNDPSDFAVVAAVIGGYYVGSVVGVQWMSRRLGMRGSWLATFGGAAAGVLGGPAVLVTMPIGATVGFDLTRRPSSDP